MITIKVRKIGERRWRFLASGGSTNYLRIHALQFLNAEAAQAVIDANKSDNPEWDWKVTTSR